MKTNKQQKKQTKKPNNLPVFALSWMYKEYLWEFSSFFLKQQQKIMFLDKTFQDGDFANCRGDHEGNDILVLFSFTAYEEGRTKVLASVLFPQ